MMGEWQKRNVNKAGWNILNINFVSHIKQLCNGQSTEKYLWGTFMTLFNKLASLSVDLSTRHNEQELHSGDLLLV